MKKLIVLLLFSSFLFSCSDSVYEKNIDIPQMEWNADSAYTFEFEINEPSEIYQISYNIRNNLEYPYHNLYLQYYLYNPENLKIKNEIQEVIVMDKKTGRPFGKGFSGIYQNSFISSEKISFPNKGKYKFVLKHYMRGEQIEGIVSVGIEIKKIAKN